MQARIKNIPMFPDLMKAMQALQAAADKGGVPERTKLLVEVRASQINGCSVCVDMHTRELKKQGESIERICTVAAWRDTPYFSDAERAALALTEAVTRIADRPDPVPDDIWQEAARHYDEAGLAGLLITIGTINVWNRLNVAIKQVSGPWTEGAASRAA